MWKKLKSGWKLPYKCVSKENYDRLRKSKTHSALRGFIGIACAYSGIFFAGYRPFSSAQNYFERTRKGLLDMVQYLKNIKFLSASNYDEFNPTGMTIYCDPPYKGNNFKSEHFDNFYHDAFWDLMRKWSMNNLVFISEYTAPKDFECVWKKTAKSVYSGQKKEKIEKLFIYKHGI